LKSLQWNKTRLTAANKRKARLPMRGSRAQGSSITVLIKQLAICERGGFGGCRIAARRLD
jgi:hypothetical protein